MLRGNENKTQNALPQERKRRKEKQVMRRRFKCDPKRITVRFPARCAEPNCQAEINVPASELFYYPSDKGRLRHSLRSRRKRPLDFNAHRIDEDGF